METILYLVKTPYASSFTTEDFIIVDYDGIAMYDDNIIGKLETEDSLLQKYCDIVNILKRDHLYKNDNKCIMMDLENLHYVLDKELNCSGGKIIFKDENYLVLECQDNFNLREIVEEERKNMTIEDITRRLTANSPFDYDDTITDDYDDDENEDEENMIDDIFGHFDISLSGLAYDGFVYDKETKTFLDVSDEIMGLDFNLLILPSKDYEVGDIIVYNDTPYYVLALEEDGKVRAISYTENIESILTPDKTVKGVPYFEKVFSDLETNDTSLIDNPQLMFKLCGFEKAGQKSQNKKA